MLVEVLTVFGRQMQTYRTIPTVAPIVASRNNTLTEMMTILSLVLSPDESSRQNEGS